MKRFNIYFILVFALSFASSCIYEYQPEVKNAAGDIVIEGDINIGDLSEFSISYSLPMDSTGKTQSLEASELYVECEDGTKLDGIFGYVEDARYEGDMKIHYVVPTFLFNDLDKRYRLKVQLFNHLKRERRTYATDFLDVYQTPPIDSITYFVNPDSTRLSICVNTHSDNPVLKNYKWSYQEDWEVRAHMATQYYYDLQSDTVRKMTDYTNQNRYYCWGHNMSTEIILGNTDKLTENAIFNRRITEIVNTDRRLSFLYAIEVQQQAISDESYNYWNNVYKNSDQLGGIFSPQPNEMRGNIFCEEDPSELVLGFVNVSTVQKQRIFIDAKKLGIYDSGKHICERQLENDSRMWKEMYYWGMDVGHYDYIEGYYWYYKICVDCRLFGTKFKPYFWPAY